MTRRTFVTDSAILTAVLFGGCTGLLDEDRKQEGVTLSHVELGNASGEPQVFDLLVTHDDEIIHWSAHEVGGGESDQEMGSMIVDIDAPDDSGHVEVAARIGENWQRTDFATDRYDGERVIVVVVYGMVEDELLRISRRIADRSPTNDALTPTEASQHVSNGEVVDMRRRHTLLAGGSYLGVLLSGCLSNTAGPATGTPTQTAPGKPTRTADVPTYDCDAANRPASPELDADPPGNAERYTYPTQPESLSNEEMRSYAEQYERAYRLNKLHSEWGANLIHASVSVEDVDTYEAPDGAAIVQIKHTYDAEIEGDDGPIEIDSPTIYASYYVDAQVVLRTVNKKLQEDTSRLVADPLEQGQPVECF